jgi:ATP-binding cassette subfamily F protein 3
VFGAHPQLSSLRARCRALEQRLADAAFAAGYAALINEYEELGGFTAEADVVKVLVALGFEKTQFDVHANCLSSGERARASLARALSSRCDLLLLDEPTNYLDLRAREWLENSLIARPEACVVISHDRAFLRAFAGRILEIDRGSVRAFDGGYDEYRRARAQIERQAWADYEAFQRRREAAETAARRRDQLARRVASAPAGIRGGKDHYARKAAKVQRTARILRQRASEDNAVEKPWEEQAISTLCFEPAQRSGDRALVADGITKCFGYRVLFHELTIRLRRGERLVIAGPNGSGKTTLLEILRGALAPDSGSVRMGANVDIACVTQDGRDLDFDRTPIEICGADADARTLLGCLKLPPDCQNRPLRDLSAGEQTKVSLARALKTKANVLFLDEPTNHLEIEAQEALEQALARYTGALVVVSHDRAFIQTLGHDITMMQLPRT